MKKALILCLMLALGASRLFAADAGDSGDTAATAIAMSGQVLYEVDDGTLKPVELGQLFDEGDRLVTKEGSSLQLVLADGSTLSLGPNSELNINALGKGDSQSKSFFELVKGTVNAIVQKLTVGAAFEIHTTDAVAAVKGTQFEVAADSGAGSAVTVQEGTVAMSDAARTHTELVPRLHRAQFSAHGPWQARRLNRMEARAFTQRWAAARAIHARRMQLLNGFRAARAQHRADLLRRRPALRKRLLSRGLDPDRRAKIMQHRAENRGKRPDDDKAKGRRRLRERMKKPEPVNP